MAAFFQTTYELVGDLLSRQIYFHVPEHQRDYSWGEDEVSQFWDDIWKGVESRTEHFLGPIVLRNTDGGKNFEIIDGQQRLTTSLILLSAIRNAYGERADALASTLQTTYFGHIDRKSRTIIPKFKMNSMNDEVFRNYIAEQKPDKEISDRAKGRSTKTPNRKILNAYSYLKSKIDELIKSDGAFDNEKLADLEEFIKEKLSVIQITVSDEADAYALFETLNERGIELSALDLLKNHLFKHAGSSREAVKRRWQETLANLDENIGSKFIRHYWVSKNGRVQAGRLYRVIRDSARDRSAVVKLSEDLLRNSELYNALSASDFEFWDEFGEDVRSNISCLKFLNAAQCMPVLMASFNMMEKEEFSKIVRLMVVMAVRYSLICQYRTGALEIAYADLAHKIAKGEIKRPGAARRYLASLYPSDQDFMNHFLSAEIRTAKHARFLLREIELQRTSGTSVPTADPAFVNLEHIMPKSQNQHWRNIGDLDGESYDSWVYRVGNLVLIEKSINNAVGSDSFEKKRIDFAKSALISTKSIAQVERWTTDEIVKRQNDLTPFAVARWKYDV